MECTLKHKFTHYNEWKNKKTQDKGLLWPAVSVIFVLLLGYLPKLKQEHNKVKFYLKTVTNIFWVVPNNMRMTFKTEKNDM